MDLQYVKGSYMAEIMFEDRPVLFTLEGLDEGRDSEALRYSMMIWDWVKDHRSRVIAHAPLIANFKNKKWRNDDEPEVSAEEIADSLRCINSVHANYEGNFDIFFDAYGLFEERSLVVSMGKNFLFKGFKIL
ncbi:MAG: hypothetical protein LKF47_03265 [Megasphaera sp.]|jgi:hypothetical protein|nr:hypothetical protein [Megasphaera sp.]MCI1247758.1 hypothetical protein [Megasphaera sp.]